MNRRQLCLAVSAAALAGPPWGAAAAEVSSALAAAVAGSARAEKNRIRDPWRHPAASLAFWGLAPGMTVVEIDPSGGYWTEIIAPYLKATGGRYIAAVGGDVGAFKARYADAGTWGAIEVVAFGDHAGVLAAPRSADMVLTARNIHDWMWTPGELTDHLAAFHAALKPAAILAVEEHRADPRPMIDDAHDGYVSTTWLEAAVEKAGFRLDGASEINANPKDDKNHPFGVWTLPPTRRTHEKGKPTPAGFDPAKYEAVGESDRMTLRFRKT
ncbi:MAG TPA: methyltransferase [Caulobacteraceae bacterium]|nr:methyltransferase [Caulobacteraceae bacterium]